jgi:hypothetical protein
MESGWDLAHVFEEVPRKADLLIAALLVKRKKENRALLFRRTSIRLAAPMSPPKVLLLRSGIRGQLDKS